MSQNVIQLAAKWSHEIASFACSTSSLAVKTGRSVDNVNEILRLLKLTDELQELVGQGLVDRQIALRLSHLPKTEQVYWVEDAQCLTFSEFKERLNEKQMAHQDRLTSAQKAITLADRIAEQLKRGAAYKDICAIEGCTIECLVNRMALLDLTSDCYSAFQRGEVEVSIACYLGKVPNALQDRYLDRAKSMDHGSFRSLLIADGMVS